VTARTSAADFFGKGQAFHRAAQKAAPFRNIDYNTFCFLQFFPTQAIFLTDKAFSHF